MTKSMTKSTPSTYQASTDSMPTKDLLKAQRKQDYEKEKAQRKRDKEADKARKLQAKSDTKAERDKALWSGLKRGTTLDGDE